MFIPYGGLSQEFLLKDGFSRQKGLERSGLKISNSKFTEVIYVGKCPDSISLSFFNYDNVRYLY